MASPNVLDALIEDQNSHSVRPPSAAQLDPNAPPGIITIAPNSRADEAAASIAAGWNQAFWNRDNAGLRNDLRLDELTTLAAQRKLNLAQDQEQGPLRTRLLEAQINASGAHDRFMQHQDAQTLEHTTGFLDSLVHPNAPGPQDPGYRNHVISSLLKYPRYAETAGGKDILKRLTEIHDTHTSIADLAKQLPEGFVPQTIEVGGGKQSHITARRLDKDVTKDLKNYGILPAQFNAPISVSTGNTSENGFVPATGGSHVNVQVLDTAGKPKSVIMPKADYLKFGGKLSTQDSGQSAEDITRVQTIEEVQKLPPDTVFIDPNGVRRRTPKQSP